MAKAKKIASTKPTRIVVGSHNHYRLEPATSRTHYGEYRQDRGGQPYAFPSKRADDAWFVVSDWSGTRHGLVQQWNDGEWTFSKIEGQQQAPSWLRGQYHDTPSTIYNLSSRLHSGSTPEEAIARGLGIPLAGAQAAHATVKRAKKIVVRKVGARWQPVDDRGMVVRGSVYNADGTGYSTRQGAAEAAAMLRQLGGRG
jgi:hypothetical protein